MIFTALTNRLKKITVITEVSQGILSVIKRRFPQDNFSGDDYTLDDDEDYGFDNDKAEEARQHHDDHPEKYNWRRWR